MLMSDHYMKPDVDINYLYYRSETAASPQYAYTGRCSKKEDSTSGHDPLFKTPSKCIPLEEKVTCFYL